MALPDANTDPQPQESIRDFLLRVVRDRVEQEWTTWKRTVVIEEVSASFFAPSGSFLRAWKRDESGLTSISLEESSKFWEDRWSAGGRMYQYVFVAYFISSESRVFDLSAVFGPIDGGEESFVVDGDSNGYRLTRTRWTRS